MNIQRKDFYIFLAAVACFFLVFISLAFIQYMAAEYIMQPYDLFHCIQTNAKFNDYTADLELAKRIQNECICFRNLDYNGSAIFEYDCTNYDPKKGMVVG